MLRNKNILFAFIFLIGGSIVSVSQAQGNQQLSTSRHDVGTIKGKIVDSSGDPIIGVSVVEKGTTNGTSTDLEGNFMLKASSAATLVVSYVGYKTVEIKASSPKIEKITLSENASILDEVVVVGYGTQKKATLSGSVATVSSESFQKKGNLSSPLQALQGQVPGVMISRASTAPGDESWSMSLRGAVSVNSTDPLVIVDGVAYESINALRNINSNDIESMNFLKDGAAAIYGSRAAGGVVLITTKQGKHGKTKVEYSGTAAVSKVGLMPSLMNIDQWAKGVMTTLENDGNTSSPWYTYVQLAQKYKGKYFDFTEGGASPFGTAAFGDVADLVYSNDDWLGSLFGDGYSTEHDVSINGGSDISSYRISLGYLYNGSTLQWGNNNNQRYNFRMNNSLKLSKRLSLESSISYNRQEQVAPTNIASALTSNLPMPGLPLETLDGKAYGWGTWRSSLAKVKDGGDNKLSVSAINFSETLKYNVTNWLDANVNLGYNASNASRNTTNKSIHYYNYTGTKLLATDPTPDNAYYSQTSAKTDFYSVSGYLNAKKTYGNAHNFSLMLGTQYEFTDYTYFGVQVKNPQEGLEIVNGSGDITLAAKTRYQNANLSYYGRFNYDYKQKYLLEYNARYDASSKFLPENRWNFFWGASAGWRMSEESFMKDLKWINDLKLRVSYAQMGNQSGISNYDGVQLYNVNSSTGAYVGDSKLSYIATNGVLASTARTWERIKNYNVAVDFTTLDQSLSGTVEAFLKKNDNMLIAITYPGVLGISAPSSNNGKFKDWGFEGKINWHNKIGDVSYNVGGVLSFARNKLVYYGGTTVLSSGYTSTKQGYSLNSIFGLRYGGKIQTEQQLNAYLTKYYENNGIGMPSELRLGDNMYVDINKDGKLDYKDYEFLGSDTPEISYSFNLGAKWKGFDFSCIFQGSANRFVYRGNTDVWVVPFRAIYTNTTTQSIGRTWSTDNPNAYYAPYSNNSNINAYNYQASSLTSQDGRYIRLKNVVIGYTVPSNIISKVKFISLAYIYLQGADLWESTKINDGWDPEAKYNPSGTQRYPFTRNYTFGVNLTF